MAAIGKHPMTEIGTPPVNRRGFLRDTAALVGALLLAFRPKEKPGDTTRPSARVRDQDGPLRRRYARRLGRAGAGAGSGGIYLVGLVLRPSRRSQGGLRPLPPGRARETHGRPRLRLEAGICRPRSPLVLVDRANESTRSMTPERFCW